MLCRRQIHFADKRAKIGWGAAEIPVLGQVFDHHWDRPEDLRTVGTLSSSQVSALTGGLIDQSVSVRLNARVVDGSYDAVLVLGATVPHEVAGFAGGAKYFFPGVAGPELTHMTHWLGALATIERVIGRIETPTRRMIEAAADLVPGPVIAFTSVMTRDARGATTRGLFAGDLRETFRRAAAISRQVHVKYAGRQYRRVIALLDEHYDELWVGGKASYKLGAIVEPGGELVIHAPHLTQISVTHGALIERYGYAPLEQVREIGPVLRAQRSDRRSFRVPIAVGRPRHIHFWPHFMQQAGGNFPQETRGRAEHFHAMQAPRFGVAQHQLLPGTGQADVGKPAFLFQATAFFQRAITWE